LLAMHDVAPVLDLERLYRVARLVEEGPQERRRCENALGEGLRRVIRVSVDRIGIAESIGEFADLAALDVKFIRGEGLPRSIQIHRLSLIQRACGYPRHASP